MSDLTPYEEELARRLKKVSLPDKTLVWEKMETLLDKDNDDGTPLPPSDNGNNLWRLLILFLLILIAGLWVSKRYLKKDDVNAKNNNSQPTLSHNITVKNITDNEAEKNNSSQAILNHNTTAKNVADNEVEKNNTTTKKLNNKKSISRINLKTTEDLDEVPGSFSENSRENKSPRLHSFHSKMKMATKNAGSGSKKNVAETNADISQNNAEKDIATDKNVVLDLKKTTNRNIRSERNINKRPSKNKKNLILARKAKVRFNVTNSVASDYLPDQDKPNQEKELTDTARSVPSQENQTIPLTDSSAKKDTTSIKALVKTTTDTSTAAKKKNSSSKKRKSYIAAGVSVQQPIRLNCDCSYPNDNPTNITEVSDYLPSVYARFYSGKKWFLQAEFKYAAPQFIQEFMYKSTIQNQPYNFIATSYVLRKVYYHQVPLSFNYFVLPNWSIGTGIVFNIFSSQVSQKDIVKKLYGLPDSLISSTIIKNNNDSGFVNLLNNTQALIETQYKWKRLSFGVRYSIGLQPYVKYVDPFSNLPAQKNNNSLNVFIRYELWK